MSGARTADFEATIARIARTDPASPAVLSARLTYAEFLLGAAPGPCAQRLERAQEQIGSAEASPEARVMFPDGWARAADLEYRLHLARTACSPETDREDELRAAAAAAGRAVQLYRNVFDYRSMVIMQFDAAIALHRLGERVKALAALEAALDMDREYGFRDDAAENYQLRLTWRGEPAGPPQVAALMRDFPERRAILRFGWRPGDAEIALESRRELLVDGQILRSRAGATLERRVNAVPGGGGWSVSYAHPVTGYEPGVWPAVQGPQMPQTVFSPALLPAVDFKLKATGEFEAATDSDAFVARLAASTVGLIRARAPSGDDARDLTQEAVETTTDVLSPEILEAQTAQNYNLETAMWIGATLEQGVWYEISAPFSLPGMPHVVVPQQIEFAFTRRVPCTAGTVGTAGMAGAAGMAGTAGIVDPADPACVEIVIRATPDDGALDDVIADLRAEFPQSRYAHYFTSIEARIVTDPATLLPYAREERIYWYASVGADEGNTLLESEHLVSTTRYGAAGPASPAH